MTLFFENSNDGLNIKSGLDIEVRNDRPLIMYHPACDRNYVSSWQIMLDIGKEFIQICNDRWPYYPEDWRSESGFQYWSRLGDMNKYDGQVHHRATESIPHRQIHIEGDASEILETLPLVDIYYDDYPCALFDGYNPEPRAYLEKICQNVVDGGLLIFDLKNFSHSNEVENWGYRLKNEDMDGKIEYLGHAEWLNLAEISLHKSSKALIFRVKSGAKKNVKFHDWVKGVIPEYVCKDSLFKPSIMHNETRFAHIDSVDVEHHREIWNNHVEFGSPMWSDYPAPRFSIDQYVVQSRKMKRMNFEPLDYKITSHPRISKLSEVQDDIFDHLHWLWLSGYSVVLRDKHVKKARRICPMLGQKLISISSENYPNSKIIWSGKNSNVVEAMDLAITQKKGVKIATMAFGDLNHRELLANLGFDEILIFTE